MNCRQGKCFNTKPVKEVSMEFDDSCEINQIPNESERFLRFANEKGLANVKGINETQLLINKQSRHK
jgi:hypothetical protein